jgi:plastocyanin
LKARAVSNGLVAGVLIVVILVAAGGAYVFMSGHAPASTATNQPTTTSSATHQTTTSSSSQAHPSSSSTTSSQTVVISVSSSSFSTSSTTTASGAQVTIPSGAHRQPKGSPATYGYNPGVITVVIGVNNTVTWVNQDSGFDGTHTVSGPDMNSGDIAPGGTYTVTFTTPGNYSYSCFYHPFMMGFVVVKAGN